MLSMLSGVSVICFAASYSVAFALEVTRLLFRSGIRGALMMGFAGAGLVAHSAFLYYRAVSTAGSPLSSERDWYLMAAWGLAAFYLYLAYYRPKIPFGLFLLPLVLGLIAVAVFLAQPEPYAREPASRAWGLIHGVSILLATISVLVGFVSGVMYFEQARRLKRKPPSTYRLRLPSLEWLQRANGRAIVASLLLLGAGVLSGAILNRINQAARVPASDPVVLSTVVMFVWLLLASGIAFLYKPAEAGRKVACLTVLSFVFLVAALAVGLFLDTQHGGKMTSKPQTTRVDNQRAGGGP